MIDKVNLTYYESRQPESISSSSLFWTFLKIGSTAFGGLMALISVVENIIVGKHKLLTHEDMLDGISLASCLPGPVAANVIAYVGYRIKGGIGALIASTAVLLPSFILIVGLTIFYLQAGEIPAVNKAFAGFIPAVTAIILCAAINMSKKAIKGWREIAIATVAALLLQLIGGFYITLIVVLTSGLIGWYCFRRQVAKKLQQESVILPNQKLSLEKIAIPLIILVGLLTLSLVPLPLGETSLAKLFITFSGMSLMLFGGGYVFIPMIQEIVVNNYQWVTQTEFSNAIAMGQITPGPILISAAFIGYVVKGFLGATVATVGIFFPPALLMVTLSDVLETIKNSVVVQAALRGIRPAVIGMIFIAAFVVGQTAQIHWLSLAIFIGAIVAILKLRVDVVFIIPIAGILGLIFY
ncbi:chromate transporter [Stanieria sp. NIES-3757]|nr:chromate transporter [Stanieria sp. NIES-3757]